MDIDKELELLKKIRRAEPPAFLLTRIMEQVKPNPPAPLTWKLVLAGAAMIVVFLNVSIFFSTSSPKENNEIETIVNVMELSTTNELYYE